MAWWRRLIQIMAVLALVALSTPLWLIPLVDAVTHTEEPMIDIRTVTLSKWKANEYLVAPQGFTPHATPQRIAPVYDRPAGELAQRFRAAIQGEPRIEWRGEADGGLRFEVIQRSKLFRFPDTVTVEALPLDAARSTLAVYSRSRYGRRDFGVNMRRVEAWLAKLDASVK